MNYLNSLFSLNGKVAIVTGAARGNGKAIAEALLGAEAIVYFVDILSEELVSLKNTIQNDRAKFVTADITDFQLIENVIKDIYEDEKRIDVLVNNAGITLPQPSEVYTDDKWESTHAINLKAPFKLSQICFKYMKRTGGAIVNITSLCSELGFSNNPAYVAFKGGLKQLTKALAKDWAKYNIRVNNLGLGYFKTEMTKGSWNDAQLRHQRAKKTMLNRWGGPEDLAGPAVFLASEASQYITGQNLYVDGGWLANGI